MVFLSTLTFFSKIMEEKRKPVLKKGERRDVEKKYVPYMVQRKHFDQTF